MCQVEICFSLDVTHECALLENEIVDEITE